MNEENNMTEEMTADETKVKEPSRKGKSLKEILTAKNAGGLILRIIILLAIPEAFLLLSGLIFDKLLKLYTVWPQYTIVIFILLVLLTAFCIFLIVRTIIWSSKAMKANSESK